MASENKTKQVTRWLRHDIDVVMQSYIRSLPVPAGCYQINCNEWYFDPAKRTVVIVLHCEEPENETPLELLDKLGVDQAT